MRTWTVHTAPDAVPAVLPESFSLGCFLFGPFWLLAHRAWIPSAILVAVILCASLLPAGLWIAFTALLAVTCGVMGGDWVRWSLERRGYVLSHVVAARDADAALGRLLAVRPDLADRCAA